MLKRKKEKELDIENLNNVIILSKRIFSVMYVMIILSIVLLAIMLFTKLNIGKVILGILSVLSPLFIGIIVAWLLDPLVTYLTKKNVKRSIASIFVFVMFLVIVFLIIKFMVPMLYKQINDFVEMVPTLYNVTSNFVRETFIKLGNTGFDFSGVEDRIYNTLQEFVKELTTSLPKNIINSVSSIVSSIGSVALGLIVSFYLLIDFDRMKKVYDIIPVKHRKTAKRLADDIDSTCKDFVQGTLLISLIVSIIASIAFAIAGLPSPMLFGIICGLTNIIPYIGPWVGGAIAAIVGFTVSPLVGIIVIVIAFIVQQIDGILLQPLIMGKTMKLHPVTIMLGLLVFGYFFGITGMIIATPLIACAKIIFIYFSEKYGLKEKFSSSEEFKEKNTFEAKVVKTENKKKVQKINSKSKGA